jgi:hypothetical protein
MRVQLATSTDGAGQGGIGADGGRFDDARHAATRIDRPTSLATSRPVPPPTLEIT